MHKAAMKTLPFVVLGAVLAAGSMAGANAGQLTGVVRDPSGAPASGVKVAVFPNWGPNQREVMTDAKGRYEISLSTQHFGSPDETACLIARDAGRNLAAAQEIEEGAAKLDLRLEPGLVVAGQVEDANGKPLSDATAQLFLWSGNRGFMFDNNPVRAGAQGRFEITALPPGRRYSLNITAKGYGSANQNIPQDAETNRVELPPSVLQVADHKLAGEVLDADDKPVAQVNVHMHGQGQPSGSVRTDDKGRFRFEEVCEGTVQLFANSQNAHGNARAEAGDTNVAHPSRREPILLLRRSPPTSFAQRQAAPRPCPRQPRRRCRRHTPADSALPV